MVLTADDEETGGRHRDEPRPEASEDGRRSRPPRTLSVRQRLLAMIVAVMTVGLTLTGVISYGLAYRAVHERVDDELTQEVSELRKLAQAGPLQDGQPYTDAEELFFAFLTSTVASQDEAMAGIVDGTMGYLTGGDRSFEIDHPDVQRAVAELPVPDGRAVATELRTQGTVLRLMVTDVQLPGDDRDTKFVVALDLGSQVVEVRNRALTYVGLSVLVLAAVAAFSHLLLGRLLRPLTELREATALTSTDDLSRRVEVDAPDNEVGELAVHFNSMLDRIEAGVREQRQFLDDAAHELRTPLTIVRGNAELLRADDPADVESSRALILDEVDRMQRLVDDLLMLARSQRPDFYQPARTDVTELALEAMERITSLGHRAWRLHAGAEGTAELDRQRILQAIVQLAANAVKFSDRGSAVELSTTWVAGDAPEAARAVEAGADPAPRYLVLALADKGIGIPEGQRGRIFDRFGRADNIGTAEGSGLGLPIVKAIADSHAGAVLLDSEEGEGSTFALWIPVAEDA
ncbi:ATP-binding protein [Ornithinimicrobium humiphilum]|uniref:histidine kinase n=1 Tax=Ornithinimicrobium humiphilum TaxID=125288 RepID=A0A543K827_9MICO|nr:HAMP domain-containing sensor histidine kinase [Ornithinimicrobium humiphilum]TQM91246.1 signal transduction histidine kinase [Ornithinimicrobium humiphilum]